MRAFCSGVDPTPHAPPESPNVAFASHPTETPSSDHLPKGCTHKPSAHSLHLFPSTTTRGVENVSSTPYIHTTVLSLPVLPSSLSLTRDLCCQVGYHTERRLPASPQTVTQPVSPCHHRHSLRKEHPSTHIIPFDEAVALAQVLLHLRGLQDRVQHRHGPADVLLSYQKQEQLHNSLLLSPLSSISASHVAGRSAMATVGIGEQTTSYIPAQFRRGRDRQERSAESAL